MCKIRTEELLSHGFIFSNSTDDSIMRYLNPEGTNFICYTDEKFALVLNGCCKIDLNIESVNELILAIDLLKTI